MNTDDILFRELKAAIFSSRRQLDKLVENIDFRLPMMQCAKAFDYHMIVLEALAQTTQAPSPDDRRRQLAYRMGLPLILKAFYGREWEAVNGLAYVASAEERLVADQYLRLAGLGAYLERMMKLVTEGLMSFEVREGVHTFIFDRPHNDHVDAFIESRFRNQEFAHLSKTLEMHIAPYASKIEHDLKQNVRPWNERMIAYESTPLLDEVFSTRAMAYSRACIDNDVFNEGDIFGDIPYSAYHHAVAMQTMFALKHDLFVKTLAKEHSNTSLPDCYTITISRDEILHALKRGFEEYGLTAENRALADDLSALQKILSVISVGPHNASQLVRPGDPIPHLIEHTPTSFIRLRSGALDNPYAFLRKSLSVAFPRDYSRAQSRQEENQIKAIADGVARRFPNLQMASNIKARRNGKVLTDIDVILLDLDREEIYLIQLKHQDPYGDRLDIRRARKDKLLQEVESWLNALKIWLSEVELTRLAKDVGFKVRKSIDQLTPKFFVVSMHHAHFLEDIKDRYDFEYATWHAFVECMALSGSFNQTIEQLSTFNDEVREQRFSPDLLLFPDLRFMGIDIGFSDERSEI